MVSTRDTRKPGDFPKTTQFDPQLPLQLFEGKQFVTTSLLVKTYPTDCRKIAAVDSHNSFGIERKEYQQKLIFV